MENGITYQQQYNAENRMYRVGVMSGDCDQPGTELSQVWEFVYDGNGDKVKQIYYNVNVTMTTYYYMGGMYEVENDGTTDTIQQYYSIGGMSIGMATDGEMSYFLTDHLGSIVAVTDDTGTLTSETRYTPFGEVRTDVDTISETDYGYTNQEVVSYIKLMFYQSRWYSPELGRFAQPDSIIAEPGSSQGYNRYSYVGNNPILYNDPKGYEKVIIYFGEYENRQDNESFMVAAQTQYKAMLAAGYSPSDIIVLQVGSDSEFLSAIKNSKEEEIEKIFVFSHGWGIDMDNSVHGGLQLGTGNIDQRQLTAEDLAGNEYLSNRFAEGSEIYLYACHTAQGTLPQALANAFNSKVYAFRQALKFFHVIQSPSGSVITPYEPPSTFTSSSSMVIMSPYLGPSFEDVFGDRDLNLVIPLCISPLVFVPSVE
jgi:RHS repeat-associated protein